MSNKYTIKQLQKDFPNDNVILDILFNAQHDKQCSCGGTYALRETRKQYQCSKCRATISPTANTVFHKSYTPLTDWVTAIYLFSQAKSGLSAKELQRVIGCTYKTAWRMLNIIRNNVPVETKKLKGVVEIDEAYIGGKTSMEKKFNNKTVLLGAIERDTKRVVVRAVDNVDSTTVKKFVDDVVDKNATLNTDDGRWYSAVSKEYKREKVTHSKKEYVRGTVHTNSIENFWSNLKRFIRGTHNNISLSHTQSYLNAFSFHHNNAHNDKERFFRLVSALTSGAVLQ